MWCKASQCVETFTPEGVFVTTSLVPWQTKAKKAPSPHKVRLTLLGTNSVFVNLNNNYIIKQYRLYQVQILYCKLEFFRLVSFFLLATASPLLPLIILLSSVDLINRWCSDSHLYNHLLVNSHLWFIHLLQLSHHLLLKPTSLDLMFLVFTLLDPHFDFFLEPEHLDMTLFDSLYLIHPLVSLRATITSSWLFWFPITWSVASLE